MKLIITEEEKKQILNLYGINEQDPYVDALSPEEKTQKVMDTKDLSNEYPNYCLYPQSAIMPSAGNQPTQGADGEDLLIPGHCLYLSPQENSINFDSSGIWLPITADTKITFSQDGSADRMVDKIKTNLDKGVNLRAPELVKLMFQELSIDEIKDQFNKVFAPGRVLSFTIDGVPYAGSFTYSKNDFRVFFRGYYLKGTPPSEETKYMSPKWIDTRNEFEKFIDVYEDVIGYASMAIGLIISIYFTGPMAIWIELGYELGVASVLAVRKFQKGDNVSGALDLIFSLFPLLRTIPAYKGYSKQTFDSLSEKLKRRHKKLLNDPNGRRAKNFYYGLNKEEKELLTTLLSEDDYGLGKLLKKVADDPKMFEEVVISELRTIYKADPKRLGQKAFWQRIIGKDIKYGVGGTMGLGYLAETLLGPIFDAEDKSKLDGLDLVIPERHKPEFYASFFSSTEEQTKNMMDNGVFDNLGKVASENKDVNQGFDNLLTILETAKNMREKLQSSQNTADSKRMESEGWIDLTKWDYQGSIVEQKPINGVVWLKVDKTTIPNETEQSVGDSTNLKKENFFKLKRILI
jgi:hypothetical protein